jgi:hypothetical protein
MPAVNGAGQQENDAYTGPIRYLTLAGEPTDIDMDFGIPKLVEAANRKRDTENKRLEQSRLEKVVIRRHEMEQGLAKQLESSEGREMTEWEPSEMDMHMASYLELDHVQKCQNIVWGNGSRSDVSVLKARRKQMGDTQKYYHYIGGQAFTDLETLRHDWEVKKSNEKNWAIAHMRRIQSNPEARKSKDLPQKDADGKETITDCQNRDGSWSDEGGTWRVVSVVDDQGNVAYDGYTAKMSRQYMFLMQWEKDMESETDQAWAMAEDRWGKTGRKPQTGMGPDSGQNRGRDASLDRNSSRGSDHGSAGGSNDRGRGGYRGNRGGNGQYRGKGYAQPRGGPNNMGFRNFDTAGLNFYNPQDQKARDAKRQKLATYHYDKAGGSKDHGAYAGDKPTKCERLVTEQKRMEMLAQLGTTATLETTAAMKSFAVLHGNEELEEKLNEYYPIRQSAVVTAAQAAHVAAEQAQAAQEGPVEQMAQAWPEVQPMANVDQGQPEQVEDEEMSDHEADGEGTDPGGAVEGMEEDEESSDSDCSTEGDGGPKGDAGAAVNGAVPNTRSRKSKTNPPDDGSSMLPPRSKRAQSSSRGSN